MAFAFAAVSGVSVRARSLATTSVVAARPGTFAVSPRHGRSSLSAVGSKAPLQSRRVAVTAAPASLRMAASPGATSEEAASAQTLKVSILIGMWYLLNIGYNITNKKVLNWFPFPWFVSWAQLAFGVVYCVALWAVKLRKKPVVPAEGVKALSLVALCHTVGHVSTVCSLGAVAVSFSHVIKSAEPLFQVAASAIFLKSVFALPVYLSLLPVIGGVVLASVSELSFTWLGFLSAMTSNVAFAARNIFSKLSMNTPKGENMGPVNLFGVLTVLSTLILAPFALVFEGAKLKAGWLAATAGVGAAVTPLTLAGYIIASGFFFHTYQEVAFLALSNVHPITHAVANTTKRVIIMAVSILVFKNPLTQNGIIGSSIALLGVLLYSFAKNRYPEKKATE
eukprot:TRINITY_DN714_c0_g1_i4.p1 TRINITY_DN714_c0_g1~~TRINITY_DN714_c0_g1_i4.p1  ORF type:complete len:394 (+),score=84.31 TRINITY_DN714_c0_g1_i4:462-1643(+)